LLQAILKAYGNKSLLALLYNINIEKAWYYRIGRRTTWSYKHVKIIVVSHFSTCKHGALPSKYFPNFQHTFEHNSIEEIIF
jgi:hypothetical protein